MPRLKQLALLALGIFLGLPVLRAEEPVPQPEKEPSVSSPASKQPPQHTNRLAKETSPYLLQHQHNPVDWYPWGEEAFAKARKENKPIFLSVGYSSCHWCHVMERESFENEEVAKQLNEQFVCIKVDREERPDIDDIYMKYVHMTRQQGGWPMSIVMNGQGVPFFGGTYYPKPTFMELMSRIHDAWTTQPDKLKELTTSVAESMQELSDVEYRAPERPLTQATITRAVEFLGEHWDFRVGGLESPRNKFPPHQSLELLVEVLSQQPENVKVREMLAITLENMRLGGIHDQVGGGFHRYATDTRWFLPHFEKMLYDNAQLGQVYARAAALLKNEEYARTARGIYDWCLREMTEPGGAFCSALDADSEGEEGKFYTWSHKEISALLGDKAARFCQVFNVAPDGNFAEEATGHETGLNIPHLTLSLAEQAKKLGLDEAALRAELDADRATLLAVRVKRVWPLKDDKHLTSWNALMLGSLAQASIHLKEPRYLAAALKNAEWLLANQRTKDGRWLATHRGGQSKLAAYLDDHAYLANAFIDLYEASNDKRWLDEAEELVAILDQHFWDAKRGGYFFTADDHEQLLVRMKNPSDNATPSGNGIAAQALVRLAKATGKKAYLEHAEKLFEAFHTLMDAMPIQVESIILAYDEYLGLAGDKQPAAAVAAEKAVSRVQKGPVIVELLAGADKFRAGSKVPLAVKLSLDEGWHVQAHEPSQPNLIGTRFTLLNTDLGKLSEAVYPEAQKLATPLGELHVYGGTALMGARLEVPADAKPGKARLRVAVEFQACDDKRCLTPERIELSLEIEIAPAGEKAETLHEQEFRQLKLE